MKYLSQFKTIIFLSYFHITVSINIALGMTITTSAISSFIQSSNYERKFNYQYQSSTGASLTRFHSHSRSLALSLLLMDVPSQSTLIIFKLRNLK